MKIEKVGTEWCAFAENGREVARSKDRALLDGYLSDLGTPRPEPASSPSERTSGLPLTAHTYTCRARSTGATCSAGPTASGFGTMCLNHGTLASHKSKTGADRQARAPEDWCPLCAEIVAGSLPKLTVKINPTEPRRGYDQRKFLEPLARPGCVGYALPIAIGAT